MIRIPQDVLAVPLHCLSLSLSLVSYAKCSEEEKVEPIRCTLLEIFELAERAEFLEISAS